MTFQVRTLSARRYRVDGDLPPIHSPEFAERLRRKRFRPLAPHEERSVGWVSADNCLDSDFAPGSVGRGPCAVFALRVDRRRVSQRLLRARVDLEWRGRAKDGGRRAKSARDERLEMRKAIHDELLAATSPTVSLHPVLYYPRERTLLFQALSRPANDAFRAWFRDTFDAGLTALTPYHRAIELLESRGGKEALAGLRRTEFGEEPADDLVPDSLRRRGASPPAPVPEAAAPEAPR